MQGAGLAVGIPFFGPPDYTVDNQAGHALFCWTLANEDLFVGQYPIWKGNVQVLHAGNPSGVAWEVEA